MKSGRLAQLTTESKLTYRINLQELRLVNYQSNAELVGWKKQNFKAEGANTKTALYRDYLVQWRLNGIAHLGMPHDQVKQILERTVDDNTAYEAAKHQLQSILPDFTPKEIEWFMLAHSQFLAIKPLTTIQGANTAYPMPVARVATAEFENVYVWKDDKNIKYVKVCVDSYPIVSGLEDGDKVIGHLRGPIEFTYRLGLMGENKDKYCYQLAHIDTNNEDVKNILLADQTYSPEELVKRYCPDYVAKPKPAVAQLGVLNFKVKAPNFRPTISAAPIMFTAAEALQAEIEKIRMNHEHPDPELVQRLERLQAEVARLKTVLFAGISDNKLDQVLIETVRVLRVPKNTGVAKQDNQYNLHLNNYAASGHALRQKANTRILGGIILAIAAALVVALGITAIVMTAGAATIPVALAGTFAALTINGAAAVGATCAGVGFIGGALGSFSLFKQAMHERKLSQAIHGVHSALAK
jgi:hypothetical protein